MASLFDQQHSVGSRRRSPARTLKASRWAAPALAFALSLAVTGTLGWYVERAAVLSDRVAFDAEVARTVDAISDRVRTTITLLNATAGLFASLGEVSRTDFARYTRQLDLRSRYPGIQGIGLSEQLDGSEVRLAYWRSQWGGQFRSWPEQPAGARHAIVLLEPLDQRNLAAIGYDMTSEPVRSAAMEAARDSGVARATGKVTLVQEIGPAKQAGLLIYLPLYRGGATPETTAARRSELRGFIYSPLRAEDLLRGTRGSGPPRIDYRLYDGEHADPAALMRSTRAADAPQTPRLTAERRIEVAGRPWLLQFASTPAFEAQAHSRFLPVLVLLPLITSALLGWITWVQAREKLAAQAADAERRAHLADLREADRRKDEFLGMLSHELRNPLAPIRNSLFILDQIGARTPPAIRAREIAQRQVAHLTRLVDDLLDITRIARGKIELRPVALDLATLVQRAADDYRALFSERGVSLRVEAPQPIPVRADETRLVQVIGNMLHNAAKFTPPGGQVVLTVTREDGSAVLRVRDTGVGMEPALAQRVFEPFTQAEQTLARSEGGLGLGLALVRGITELHGGSVAVASAGIGQGSEFTVRLPLAPADGSGEPQASA